MARLARELLPLVVSYFSADDLKRLFDDPILGPLCFNRYYRTVRVDYLGDEYLDEFLEDGGELIEDTTEYTDNVTRAHFEWDARHFMCVRFMTMLQFVRFCEANQHIYDFNHVIFSLTNDFLDFKQNHPEFFNRYRKIDVAIKFYETLDRQPGSMSFAQSVAAEMNNFNAITKSVNLNFLKVFHYAYDSPLMPIADIFPVSVNKSTLTNLRLNNIDLANPADFFQPFDSLRILYLHRVPISAKNLVYLPPSITNLALCFAIIMAEPSAALELPKSIQYLRIVGLKLYSEPDTTISIDISHLKDLQGFSLTSGTFKSLADIWLPKTLKFLFLSSCNHLQDLSSVERYKSLTGLKISSCYRLSNNPSVFSIDKMPLSLTYFRYEANGGTSSDMQASIIAQYNSINDQYYYSHDGEKYLKINEAFSISPCMEKLSIGAASCVVLSSLKFPEHLKSLRLGYLKSIVDVEKLRFPSSLQELSFCNTTIKVINGLVLPEKLEVFEINDCGLEQFMNTNLKELKYLKKAFFFRNELTDSSAILSQIPSSIEVLHLQSNLITKACVSHLSNLKKLNLASCRFEAIDDATLSLPSCLLKLELQANGIEKIDKSFKFPDAINTLKLEDNNIAFLTDENIHGLPSDLEYFDFSRNSGRVQRSNARLPVNLKYFSVYCNEDLDGFLSKLQYCKKLERLFAASTPIATLNLNFLPASLKQCDLSAAVYHRITGNIDHLDNLKAFYFASNSLRDVQLKLPSCLQIIDIQNCEIKQLSKHIDFRNCKDLIHIMLDDPHFDEENLLEVLESIKKVSPVSFLHFTDYSSSLKAKCEAIGVHLLDS